MTALLEVPQNSPPTLDAARRRFDAAKEAHDSQNDPGADWQSLIELKNAENCVRLIEALEIRKMRGSVV